MELPTTDLMAAEVAKAIQDKLIRRFRKEEKVEGGIKGFDKIVNKRK